MAERKIVLKNCEVIDPRNIDSSIAHGGSKALIKAKGMTPEAVIAEIKASGLRGRGGAGFPVGFKWENARKSIGDMKYLVCNADEGEVGTFKDRYIIENDPFILIEGIAIASYAIGAVRAVIYLRAEYRRLKGVLESAIAQAESKGFLAHVEIMIRDGAGAYVCGEETALLESLEGRRGHPRLRPPYPTERGLFEQPTVINNVETLSNIPFIISNGALAFSRIGIGKSNGTKVFSVSGDVTRPGVYELEMGSSLEELVVDLAGAESIKFVHIGGAAGRIIPESLIETPLSYENILGAGAVTVYGESRDIVEVVRSSLEFLQDESCGKCAPCRKGTEQIVHILKRFEDWRARSDDIPQLERLATIMTVTSLCGLGQAAPVPLTDGLLYFRADFENRVRQKTGAGFSSTAK